MKTDKQEMVAVCLSIPPHVKKRSDMLRAKFGWHQRDIYCAGVEEAEKREERCK